MKELLCHVESIISISLTCLEAEGISLSTVASELSQVTMLLLGRAMPLPQAMLSRWYTYTHRNIP